MRHDYDIAVITLWRVENSDLKESLETIQK
jgi:hypothetical protein